MSLIFLAKGHAHLGMNKVDKDGNVTESTPAQFFFTEDGSSVAVGEIDPETMKINEDSVYLYGDWDAAGYLAETMKRLNPDRLVNIPDFKTIVLRLLKEGIDICDQCPTCNCRDCTVKEWKEEEEE